MRSGKIAFLPRLTPDNFKCAFTGAGCWGIFCQTRQDAIQHETIEVKWGELRLRALDFALPEGANTKSVAVKAGRKALAATQTTERGRVQIRLSEDVVITAGQEIKIIIQFQAPSELVVKVP